MAIFPIINSKKIEFEEGSYEYDRHMAIKLRNRRILLVICIVIAIALLILALMVKKNIDNTTGHVKIAGLSDCMKKSTAEMRDRVETKTYSVVKKYNTDRDIETKSSYSGTIRDDTCTVYEDEFESQTDGALVGVTASFLVDIDEAEQSYAVKYYYISSDYKPKSLDFDTSPELYCPSADQNIYENFKCIKTDIVGAKLPTRTENIFPATATIEADSYRMGYCYMSAIPSTKNEENIAIKILVDPTKETIERGQYDALKAKCLEKLDERFEKYGIEKGKYPVYARKN